jgi:hypothetical protein
MRDFRAFGNPETYRQYKLRRHEEVRVIRRSRRSVVRKRKHGRMFRVPA